MIHNSEIYQDKCRWKTSCNLTNIPTTDDIKFNGEVLDIRFCKSKAACIRSDNCCERWGEVEGDLGLISWEVKVWGVGDRGRSEEGGVLERAVSVYIRVGGEGSERHITETERKRLQIEFFNMDRSLLNPTNGVARLLLGTSAIATELHVSKKYNGILLGIFVATFTALIPCAHLENRLPCGDILAPGDGVCLFITDECGIPRPKMVMGLLLESLCFCD